MTDSGVPEMRDDVLRVDGLSTRFFTGEGQVNAVENVSFDVRVEGVP